MWRYLYTDTVHNRGEEKVGRGEREGIGEGSVCGGEGEFTQRFLSCPACTRLVTVGDQFHGYSTRALAVRVDGGTRGGAGSRMGVRGVYLQQGVEVVESRVYLQLCRVISGRSKDLAECCSQTTVAQAPRILCGGKRKFRARAIGRAGRSD